MGYDVWAGLVERIGVPAIALGFVGFCLWRLIKWSASNVVTPLVDSHRELIETLSSSIKEISETQSKQVAASERRQVMIEEIHKVVSSKCSQR